LIYAPISYEQRPIEPATDETPHADWVAGAFLEFVRGEFGRGATAVIATPVAPAFTDQVADERVVFDYLAQCEEQLVYRGLVDASIAAMAGGDTCDQLLGILTLPQLGNRENARNVSPEKFRQKVQPTIDRQITIHFLVPSFPFKDQNPLRTEGPAYHPDLGELALLIRLHCLSLAMYQVHAYGADWTIVSDGLAYAGIFNVRESDAEGYIERLLAWRRHLNLQGSVRVVDLLDLSRRLVSKDRGAEIFNSTYAAVASMVADFSRAEGSDLREAFRVLVRGMKWNMNSRDLSEDWADLWSAIQSDDGHGLAPGAEAVWSELNARSERAAVQYAAFNLSLRYHDALHRLLPDSVRATVHAKAGQLAVPELGSVAPWNGVGVLRPGAGVAGMIETEPLYRLAKDHARLERWRLTTTRETLYYVRS
jgi:hypothetical protein